MKVEKVTVDENTFGVTCRSLKMLRDTMALRATHQLAIVEIPTFDLCCGFLIFDQDSSEAIFTGDGFRSDKQGEGGAGFITAIALLRIFGFSSWTTWDPFDFFRTGENLDRAFFNLASKIADTLTEGDFKAPLSTPTSDYLRGL